MEGLVMGGFWRGRKVLITGHTGFKGSWLAIWLANSGAEVVGLALEPSSQPSLFIETKLDTRIHSEFVDIRDAARVFEIISSERPDVVFHLAAQPLVRDSYEDPLGTYTTNVIGTANLLDAVRRCDSVRAVVVVTTDKCYENREWNWPYREIDELGGYDPYSSSKACAELVTSAYRTSFFPLAGFAEHRTLIASARAGNVIGGGDWAKDRLVPDLVRAFHENRVVKIRNPKAVRPWQHVLEPLAGYLQLAERLVEGKIEFAEAWNFGPDLADTKPVEWVVAEVASAWGDHSHWEVDSGTHPHEAQTLRLDCSKAHNHLRWRPKLSLAQALDLTSNWYRCWYAGADAFDLTIEQIERYERIPNQD